MSNVFNGGFLHVVATGANTATSGTSAGGTIPLTGSATIPKFIRVVATAASHIRIGAGAQTAVTTDLLVQPADAVILAVSGATHYAVIQASGPGVVQVSPLENC